MNTVQFVLGLHEHCPKYVKLSNISSSLDEIIKSVKKIDLSKVNIQQKNGVLDQMTVLSSMKDQLSTSELLGLVSNFGTFREHCADMSEFLSSELKLDMKNNNMGIVPILCASCSEEDYLNALNINYFKLKDDNSPWVDGEQIIKFILSNHRYNLDLRYVANFMSMLKFDNIKKFI